MPLFQGVSQYLGIGSSVRGALRTTSAILRRHATICIAVSIRMDGSSLLTSKTRAVLLVLSIVVMLAVAPFLLTSRHFRVITSIAPPASMPAATHPAGMQHVNAPPPRTNDTGTVEVCGYGQLPLDKSDASGIFQHVGALTKGAGTKWLSALQNSDDLRARVAGLLLEGKVAAGGSLRPIAEQTRNEVIQLAEGVGDPAVYAMALSMCDSSATSDVESACRQLSLQRWTRMDPDNAVPWLLLAGKARARHDSAAESDAFSHAAIAHKIDSYTDSVLAFAEPELPRDVTPLERSYLATEVIGIESAMWSPQYSVAGQHCSNDAMKDNTVRQQCDSLAELLVTKGTNLLDLGLAKTIGVRAGWPNERVEELALEQNALLQTILQQFPSDNDKLWTCDAVTRVNAYMVQRVRRGELGALRDALERSGETVEAMAQKYTRYLDNLRRDALSRAQQNSPETGQ